MTKVAKKPKAESKKRAATKTPDVEVPEVPGTAGSTETSGDIQSLVDYLKKRGYNVDRTDWNNLTDAEQNNVRRWVEDLTHGIKHSVPPCMMEFDTNGGTRQTEDTEEGYVETFFLPCEFGRVSYEETGSVPGVIPKECLTAEQAEKLLCNSKVGVVIELRDNSERSQQILPGCDSPPRLEFVIDSKGYRSSKDGWHFTMKFGIETEHLDDFFAFAGRTGRVELVRLGTSEKVSAADQDQPHPDVEAGKDRPHGTPIVAAAAQAYKEQSGRSLLDEAEKNEANSPRCLEYFVIPTNRTQCFLVRLKQFADMKWRAQGLVRFEINGAVIGDDAFPEESHRGMVTMKLAVIAFVESWIGRLQKVDGDFADDHMRQLREYLRRVDSGESPKAIDAELMQSAEQEGQDDEEQTPADIADAVFGGGDSAANSTGSEAKESGETGQALQGSEADAKA